MARHPSRCGRFVRTFVSSLAVCCAVAPAQGADPLARGPGYRVTRLLPDTPFPGCNGATIGPDGALYVVHTGNGATTRIDLQTHRATRFIQSWAATFIPDDITYDGKGHFFSTGTTAEVGEVYRIDAKGMKTVIASGLSAPNGIQYNPRTDRLFVTECFGGNRVFEVDPGGGTPPRVIVPANTIPVPEGFGFDPDTNDLVIPDLGTGKILRVHPDTGNIQTIAEGFVTPVALKVGPDKMAYFPEMVTGKVWRLSLDGKTRQQLAQLPPGLDNLAITADGKLFITSYWDATVFEVASDGSGKFTRLFTGGTNQITGIALKGDKVWVADAIMIRSLEGKKYLPSKINAWALKGCPLPLGLTAGPGDQFLWPDWITNTLTLGNPATGEFKVVAGKLARPVAALMSERDPKVWVAEYESGQVTEVSLTDGGTKVVAKGLEGPLALAAIDDTLYVAESKVGRISKVELASGRKEVFVSGVVGKVSALAKDRAGRLLALDGASGDLFRIDPRDLSVARVAERLPVGYGPIGSYPALEPPLPMAVASNGDVYVPTAERGLLVLKESKAAAPPASAKRAQR
jgi:sugar lactone lactonase YvrE